MVAWVSCWEVFEGCCCGGGGWVSWEVVIDHQIMTAAARVCALPPALTSPTSWTMSRSKEPSSSPPPAAGSPITCGKGGRDGGRGLRYGGQ